MYDVRTIEDERHHGEQRGNISGRGMYTIRFWSVVGGVGAQKDVVAPPHAYLLTLY